MDTFKKLDTITHFAEFAFRFPVLSDQQSKTYLIYVMEKKKRIESSG